MTYFNFLILFLEISLRRSKYIYGWIVSHLKFHFKQCLEIKPSWITIDNVETSMHSERQMNGVVCDLECTDSVQILTSVFAAVGLNRDKLKMCN